MTLTKPGCFRIWDVRAYRKAESQSASQWDLWLCCWKGTSHTGVHCGEDIGALCSSQSLGTKQALHTMQGDDICPLVHTHSSGPAARSCCSSWVAECKSPYLKKKNAPHQVLQNKWCRTLPEGVGGWGEGGGGGGGCMPLDCWSLIALHYDLGRVSGFRSVPPLRYFTGFPRPHWWPRSG